MIQALLLATHPSQLYDSRQPTITPSYIAAKPLFHIERSQPGRHLNNQSRLKKIPSRPINSSTPQNIMSWQSYVESNLLGTKKINAAGIYGHDKSTWATSAGFQVSPQELEKLYAAFKDASGIRAGGLYMSGKKYIALKCDDRSVYGKLGSGGVVCVKTKQAVLIGTYDESVQPGEATSVVEKLADYLISVNY